MHRFMQQLELFGFTPSEQKEIAQAATELELPTRHILTAQGEVATHIYYILDGLCHACYLTEDGKQYSKEFCWEQDWVIGFESLIRQQPSPYLLETLTPVTLICLPVETLQRWRDERHPLYIRLLETQLMYKENKERFMLLHTPEERYELFCQSFPQLETRITDGQIASYLGITPISLSRIKKRLKLNKS